MTSAFSLKEGMLLGVATPPPGAAGVTAREAGGAGARVDALLMKRMGIRICQVSVDWARVEPEEGSFSTAEFEKLRDELVLDRSLGIQPLLVLLGFSAPEWFIKKGGWSNRYNIRYYLRYVERATRALGHLADEYLTMHEPNLCAVMGVQGDRHGLLTSPREHILQRMSVMASAHIQAYVFIHRVRQEMGFQNTRVGFSLRMRVFAPHSRANIIHGILSRSASKYFEDYMAEAMITGRFAGPMRDSARAGEGIWCDFIGMSYYTRSVITASGQQPRQHAHKTDIGWEIYPRGIVECAEKLTALRRLPIYITGNGVCDNEDAFRSRYIYEHLLDLCLSDLPVERYYHRCLADDERRSDGELLRFGLTTGDPEGGVHRVKRSGEFYSRIIAGGGVSDELYEEYVRGQEYHL